MYTYHRVTYFRGYKISKILIMPIVSFNYYKKVHNDYYIILWLHHISMLINWWLLNAQIRYKGVIPGTNPGLNQGRWLA